MLVLTILCCLYILVNGNTCPDGTMQSFTNENICYSFNPSPKSWQLANFDCNKKKGNLTAIPDSFTNGFIAFYAQNYFNLSTPDFWTGGSDYFKYRIFQWIDGTPWTFTNWAAGEPSTVPNSYCVASSLSTQEWSAQNCDINKKPYVCSISSQGEGQGEGSCAPDWLYFKDTQSCYRAVMHNNSNSAEAQCELSNSHLTSIHSDKENNFVTYLVSLNGQNSPNYYWIGLRSFPNGTWYWTDGTPLDYAPWAQGFPERDAVCGAVPYNPFYNPNATTTPPQKSFITYDCNAPLAMAVCKKSL